MKRCLYFLVVFILVAFVSFCLFLSFSQYKVGVIIGESMTPTINEGDLVVLLTTNPSIELKEGMIVIYRTEEAPVLHRIATIKEEVVITKGDANEYFDSPISISDIEKIYLFKIPHIGKIVPLMRKKVGPVPLFLIINIFLVFLLTVLIVRRKIREREN